MKERKNVKLVTEEILDRFKQYLREEERSRATVRCV